MDLLPLEDHPPFSRLNIDNLGVISEFLSISEFAHSVLALSREIRAHFNTAAFWRHLYDTHFHSRFAFLRSAGVSVAPCEVLWALQLEDNCFGQHSVERQGEGEEEEEADLIRRIQKAYQERLLPLVRVPAAHSPFAVLVAPSSSSMNETGHNVVFTRLWQKRSLWVYVFNPGRKERSFLLRQMNLMNDTRRIEGQFFRLFGKDERPQKKKPQKPQSDEKKECDICNEEKRGGGKNEADATPFPDWTFVAYSQPCEWHQSYVGGALVGAWGHPVYACLPPRSFRVFLVDLVLRPPGGLPPQDDSEVASLWLMGHGYSVDGLVGWRFPVLYNRRSDLDQDLLEKTEFGLQVSNEVYVPMIRVGESFLLQSNLLRVRIQMGCVKEELRSPLRAILL